MMTPKTDVQRIRAAQVGFAMRAYRESFTSEAGRRGLTQEELLQRMAAVDSEYGERFSHATVSRWESGVTRPTVHRLKAFGRSLNLSQTEVAGLILLAGLAPDFQTAWDQTTSSGVELAVSPAASRVPGPSEFSGAYEDTETPASYSMALRDATRLLLLRWLPLVALIVACGQALALLGLNDSWTPVVYVGLVTAVVLAQGLLLPERGAIIRDFYWVSLFLLLTTPLLQFAPLRMDHYNFYRIADFYGTQMPYMLALLSNLTLAMGAGLLFQALWKWQSVGRRGGSNVLRRATWTVLPPVVIVYAFVMMFSNMSVWIQLAILLPVVAAVFIALIVVNDPSINPSEGDRHFLLSTTVTFAIISTLLGSILIMAIYVSPDLPSVLPDHNLVRSWELDFVAMGITRAEALDLLNLGYVWHAMCIAAYVVFILGGNLLIAMYRMRGRDALEPTMGAAQQPAGVPTSDAATGATPTVRA